MYMYMYTKTVAIYHSRAYIKVSQYQNIYIYIKGRIYNYILAFFCMSHIRGKQVYVVHSHYLVIDSI